MLPPWRRAARRATGSTRTPAGRSSSSGLGLRPQSRAISIAVLALAFPSGAKVATRPLLGPGAVDVTGLVQVANLYGVDLAAPWEEYAVDLILPCGSAHHMDLLVILVQEAASYDGVAKDCCRIIFGLQLLEGVAEFHGERTNAGVELLLRVACSAIQHPSRVHYATVVFFCCFGTILVGPDPSFFTTHIWETDSVGMQEDALTPSPVLHHLL